MYCFFFNRIANGGRGDSDDTGWRIITEYQFSSFISISSVCPDSHNWTCRFIAVLIPDQFVFEKGAIQTALLSILLHYIHVHPKIQYTTWALQLRFDHWGRAINNLGNSVLFYFLWTPGLISNWVPTPKLTCLNLPLSDKAVSYLTKYPTPFTRKAHFSTCVFICGKSCFAASTTLCLLKNPEAAQ